MNRSPVLFTGRLATLSLVALLSACDGDSHQLDAGALDSGALDSGALDSGAGDSATPDGGADAGTPCDEPGAMERVACGNCGETERFCTAGGTWAYGACEAEGECAAGATTEDACGMCGTQASRCSAECAWIPEGTCSDEGECAPGASMQTSEGCESGEQRTLMCNDSCALVEVSACEAEECPSPGAVETLPCGMCGSVDRFCTSGGTWSYGLCEGEGVCAAGTSETVACGSCGTQTRRCTAECAWGVADACTGEGECAPGARDVTNEGCATAAEQRVLECNAACTFVEIEACSAETCDPPGVIEDLPCGNCGTMERFCTAARTWTYDTCMDEGVCVAGSSRSEPCGLCGTQAMRCSATTCGWEPFGACTGERVCTIPADTCLNPTTLRTYGRATCSAGTCAYTSTDTVCPGGCAAAACVGGATLISGLGGAAGFGPEGVAPADDTSSAAIPLTSTFPSGLNFYGVTHTALFVNNNGNISFGAARSTYTPAVFPSTMPIIAPWWGDVDTRGDGRPAQNNVDWFTDANRVIVTWHLVGYYNMHDDLQNSFQVILTDRSDVAPGDFDAELRYAQCEWTTGDASGGTGGLGGTPAQAGFDGGNSIDYLALPGSGTATILDLCTSSNVSVPGVWRYQFRSGFPL